MILRAAVCAMLLAVPASAACRIPMPPPKYAGPTWYDPTIRILPYWDVDAACLSMGVPHLYFGERFDACAPAPYMILSRVGVAGITLEDQRCEFFHERGHLAGWPANHPGEVFQ